MLEAIKPLIDSGIVNEETKRQIQEAWDARLAEAREEVKAEVRAEFARRYDHDKSQMVEALDKMVTDSLKQELVEFSEDKRKLVADRVNFKKHVVETSRKFKEFMTSALAEEIGELRKDRKVHQESVARLEKFVVRALAEEISEFATDKKDLTETKVRLLATAKQRIAETHKQFVMRSAALVKESIAKNLKVELKQFKNDIQTARENLFGRRIFEAFATEFSATHLNENAEISKLRKEIDGKDKLIAESKKLVAEKAKLVESKQTELTAIRETQERSKALSELCAPLNAEKSNLMRELLENVQTPKLKSAFDKYLPAVLNGAQSTPVKKVLAEGRKEVTGDKTAKTADEPTDSNVVELKRLAGLK